MKKFFYKLILIFLIVQVGYFAYSFLFDRGKEINSSSIDSTDQEMVIIPEKQDRIEKIEIVDGSTYGALMEEMDIPGSVYMEIYDSSEDVYDLVKIRLGRFIELVYDKDTDEFKELKYKIDTEDELHIRNTKYLIKEDAVASSTEEINTWIAEVAPIPYEIKVVRKEGVVETSVYMAAINNDIDERAIIDLANAFQWSIDFAMDPRVGDTFKMFYEERYLDGEYVMPGRILAGVYVNDGKEFDVYYFEESDDNIGYFDKDANSVQKMFLKAPVEFRYISSGYTTGSRVVMEIGLYGPHRAIDYAAPMGTPIRSVGNGTITFAGWSSSGYGYLTKIRHNGTYSTNYAHQSRIGVRVGQKVSQGDIIGYVGSTGYSTGPHLHYEMVKNGSKIDPLKEILPPGKPIKEENKERFFSLLEEYNKQLN
ncbi:MAG: peptidoglycan DD-metalloendopeptidase family protein [Patescibacteria group bacterium]|jgi:murein DD-endopeptidase MepM/ murein hydrolase activator NlpD|nr:peptidoglycan DD-metalloendopeptidase family protein [Patescibacteria group bacterium]